MSVPSTGERTIGNGRYVLLREIGWGGAGVVWRGEDRVIQRPVAIKEAIMSRNLPEQQRDVAMQRMLREVRATGQLNHPAALTIHDVIWDEESGAAHIVMELVDGSSLAETLKRTGPMRPEWAARVALDVLGALEAAHESGIVHRDVKPSNIMLPADDDAPVKLADFGLAWINGDARLTQTNMIVGSPAYLSPEQVDNGPVTSATDLWQLGVTLYHMVDGRSPFEREDQQTTVFAVAGFEPPPPDCGEPLASAIAGLLNKDPAKRPTAAGLRAVLEQYATGDRTSEPGTTASRPSRGVRWRKSRWPRSRWPRSRWHRRAAVAGTVLLVVCAGTGGAVLGRRFLSPDPAQPRQVSALSWDSEMSGPGQDDTSMDMSKLDFENTACLNRPPGNSGRFQETSCVVPHASEVFDSYDMPAPDNAAYPAGRLRAAADDFCRTSYARYGNSSWLQDQDVRLTSLFPSESRWNLGKEYSHAVYCVASRVDDQALPTSGLKLGE